MNLHSLLQSEGLDPEALPFESEPAPSGRFEFEPLPAGTRLRAPSDFDKVFADAGAAFDVDPVILKSIAFAESGFDPDIISGKKRSRAGAIGLMQFMPDTAKEYDNLDPTNPVQSIFAAAQYMRKSLDKFGGDYGKAVASYNHGPNRDTYNREDWDQRVPPETQKYLMTVFDAAGRFKDGRAERSLPSGVAPSKAGAGRGSVSPGMTNTQDVQAVAPKADTLDAKLAKQGEFSPLEESGKGLQSGYTGLKQMWEANKVLKDSVLANSMAQRLSAFDRIDAGATDVPRAIGLAYQQADAAGRAKIRADVQGELAGRKDFIGASMETIRQYQAEQQRTKGRTTDLTDVGNLKDFGNWLAFNGASGVVSMAPLMVAAVATGPAAPFVTGALGYGMATGELAGDRINSAQGKLSPQRFSRNPDRYDDAVRAENQNVIDYVAKTAGSTVGAAVPFAALDVVAGPVGSLLKGAGKEMAQKGVKYAAKEIGKDTAEETATGGAQEVIKILTENALGEQDGILTGENLKRVINSAAAEGAGGMVGGAGRVGYQAATRPAPTVESQPTTPQVPPTVAPTAPVTPDTTKTQAVDNIAAAIKELEGGTTQTAPVQPGSQAADVGAAPVAQGSEGANEGSGYAGAAAATGQSESAQSLTQPGNFSATPTATVGTQTNVQAGPGFTGQGIAAEMAALKARNQPAASQQAQPQIFTGKSALFDGYGASVGSVEAGDRKQLMVDPNGGYFWGDWKQESQRDVGAVAGGADKDATPASFTSSKEARQAAASTPLQAAQTTPSQPAQQQQAKPRAKPQPLLNDTEAAMLADFERMYQSDVKGEIKTRLGLIPARQDEATAPTEKRKPSELLAAIKRAGGIKSTNAADLMGGSAMDANRILPGLFTKGGMNLDLLVPFLKERGYLTQSDEDSIKDNGGVNKLAEILQAELSGARAQTMDSTAGFESDAEAAMRSELDSKAFALGLPMKVTNEMSTERLNGVINRIERKLGKPVNTDFATRKMNRTEAMAERQAILMADRVERARAQYDADIQAFAEANDRVQKAVLDVMVDEDGNIDIIYESTVGEAYDNRNVQEDSGQAGAPVAQGARAGAGNPEADRTEAGAGQEGLTSYTSAEVTARQDSATKAEATAKRAEEAAARAEAAAKQASEIAQRSVAAADTFELGGNAEDNLSGQQGLRFSRASENRAARAALARIMEKGVTSPDDLRDLLRVPGYSKWAKSTIAGDVAGAAALRRELQDAFPGSDWKAPKLIDQGIITIYPDWVGLTSQSLDNLTKLADKYDTPIGVRGGAATKQLVSRLDGFGFELYNGLQERADRMPNVMFGMIRPAGGITATTPLFSQGAKSPRTPISTITQAITKAYGNLLTRLEGKGLVSLTQTEEEAIAAAAQARADQNGGDVEAIKQAMRASVLASQRGKTTGMPETQAFTLPKPLFIEKFSQRAFESFLQDFDDGGVNNWDQESIAWRFENVLLPTIIEARKKGVEYIDFYHVTDADLQDFSEKGILGSAVDNTGAHSGSVRRKAVYGFLDPFDIKAGFDGVLGSTSETPNVLHVKIPIDKVGSMFWDGNFNVSFGTYSGVSQIGNIPYEWIDGAYEFNSENGVFSGRAEFKNQPDSPSTPTSHGVDIRRSADGNLEGFFDPATGKSFLIADNLTAESAPGTLMHEVGIHMAADGKLEPLFTRAANLLKMARGNAFIQRVQSRMDEAGETSNEEAAAYIVTEYENDRAAAPDSVVKWVKDFIADVRAWLFGKGVLLKADQLTVADIAAVARANANRMAKGDGKGDVRYSKQSMPDKRENTETPEFQRWFGDSKVVDADGKPLRVYHGTAADFDAFDNSKTGANDLGLWGRGHYFASSPTSANSYALRQGDGARVVPAYVSIQNPLVLRTGSDLVTRLPDGTNTRELIGHNLDGSKIKAIAMDGGHDGVIQIKPDGSIGDVVAFNPEQIKSATGNNGDFDPTNPDIRRSVRGGRQVQQAAPVVTTWDDLGDSKMDSLIYEGQDDRIDLKRVQENIAKAGRQVREEFDARMAETLFPGRVAKRNESFVDHEVKPLLQAMSASNVSMEELGDYLLARHAPERNAQIAKVNPGMPDGGAGTNSQGVLMTTQAAQDHIANLSAGKRTALQLLARQVDAITKGTREMLVTEGLEKASTVAAWEGAYQNYVPLFKDEAAETPGHPVGSGFSVKGGASKRAMGSTKEVTNVLAHVLMQREAAITRAEKNRVAMSLYGLALSNPNKEFWGTVVPNMSTPEILAELQNMGVNVADAFAGMEATPTIRYVDPNTGLVTERPNPVYKNLGNALVVKVNGEDRVILFNKQNARAMRLAESLKNQNRGSGVFVEGTNLVAPVTRFMASMLTQYNPAFGMVNAVRDIQGALVNLSSTDLKGQQAKVLAGVHAAMKGIARDLRGDKARTQWSDLWLQFQDDGGRTGIRDLVSDPYEKAGQIEKDLKRLSSTGKLTPGNAAHAVLDLLSGFNDTLENGVRLSAYKTALDQGMSRPAAAKLARELTVDFNRKGRTGRELGKLYAFLNASIQGSARTIQSLKGPMGAKIMAGGFAIGVLQAFMLAWAGFDDEDIPEFIKSRNLIIPMGGDRYVTIPMALGLHVLPNAGRVVTELVMSGGKDLGDKSLSAITEIVTSFNPFGGGGDWQSAHGPLTMVTPTVMDPVIDMAMNRDFTGRQISKERRNPGDVRPGATMAREGTKKSPSGQVYIGLSELINKATLGTDVTKGAWSPTPEELRYMATVLGGGVYRETERAVNAAVLLAKGEEVKPHQVPLGSRFAGTVDAEMSTMSRYYKNDEALNKFWSEFRAEAKDGNTERVAEMKRDPRFAAAAMNSKIEQHISKLNKLAGENVGDKAKYEALNQKRAELMKKVNDAVKEAEAK